MTELHWVEQFLTSLAASRADREVDEVPPNGDPSEAMDLDNVQRLAWCVQQLTNNDRRLAKCVSDLDRRISAIEDAFVSLLEAIAEQAEHERAS